MVNQVFLDSTNKLFDQALSYTEISPDLATRIRVSNSTYTINFGVKLRNEMDLVRSGLDDMMREAYQKVRESMIENDIPNLRTAAYKVALDRIATSYDSIGL